LRHKQNQQGVLALTQEAVVFVASLMRSVQEAVAAAERVALVAEAEAVVIGAAQQEIAVRPKL
jgi:hypothetical protein